MPNARYKFIQQVAQLPSVRERVARVADRMYGQAVTLAKAEGVTAPIAREDGTRPQGRPYSRIAIRAADEFGDSRTRRSRILGRVVGR